MQLAPLQLRTRDLLHAAADSTFSLDSSLWVTLKALVTRPGRVADAWIAGQRRRFVNPFKLMALLGVLVALAYEPLLAWRGAEDELAQRTEAVIEWNVAQLEASHAERFPEGPALTELEREAVRAKARLDIGRTLTMQRFMNKYLGFVCMAVLLPHAWMMALFARLLRARSSWLEWYVLGLYCYVIAVIGQLALELVAGATPSLEVRSYLTIFKVLLPFLVVALSAMGFVQSWWRGLAAALLGQAVVVAAIMGAQRFVLG